MELYFTATQENKMPRKGHMITTIDGTLIQFHYIIHLLCIEYSSRIDFGRSVY